MIVLELENVRFTLENDGIKTMIKKKIPRYLYKYYSLSNNSLRTLSKSMLFFAHPHQMNDVMDSNPLLWDLEKYSINYKEIRNCPHRIENIERIQRILLHVDNSKEIGILSLGSSFKNNLMWPHYTQEQGFCIEFESFKLFNDLTLKKIDNTYFFPVSYLNDVQQIEFNSYCSKNKTNNLIIENDFLPILYAYSIKDISWKYEDEWRFLMHNSNFEYVSAKAEFSPISKLKSRMDEDNQKRCIPIKKNLISKVILGQLFFSTDRFLKMQGTLNDIEIFYFIEKSEKNKFQLKILKEFLEILFDQYPQKIFQVDNFIDDNKEVKRDIKYKVNILEITESSISIKRTLGYFKAN